MEFLGSPPSPYDEVFTVAGEMRAPYVELERLLGTDPLRPTAPVWYRLRERPLGDDARILPIPWALDGLEYARVLQRGTSQRARALQMFFADLVLGSQRFLDTASLTREQLDLILRSEGTSLADLRERWSGHEAEEIRFVYGPDLVRGPDARWLLLEDNVGCVGGSADGHVVWTRYLDEVVTPGSLLPRAEPDLRAALRRWLQRLNLKSGTDAVVGLLGCTEGGDGLHSVLIDENTRRRLILEEAGIRVADPGQLENLCSGTDTGVRAILNFHSLSEQIEVAFRDRTALFNAPGTHILGNKALLPQTDEMIRFFLREEPFIATPPTYVCHEGTLPAPTEDWVVKSAAGCQGTEVFLLRGQPPERLAAIRELVGRSWPDRLFVAQQRVEPSRLSSGWPPSWEAHPVELRPVAYVVGWSEVHVSARPVGKGIWGFDAFGRHNLSQGACYVPVTVVIPAAASTLQPNVS